MSRQRRSSAAPIGLIVSLLLAGCGPSISETRVGVYPPREAACAVELIKTDLGIDEMLAERSLEVVGHVYIDLPTGSSAGEYLPVVRPRACAMGGEAYRVLIVRAGERTLAVYMVMRKRQAPAPASPAAEATSI